MNNWVPCPSLPRASSPISACRFDSLPAAGFHGRRPADAGARHRCADGDVLRRSRESCCGRCPTRSRSHRPVRDELRGPGGTGDVRCTACLRSDRLGGGLEDDRCPRAVQRKRADADDEDGPFRLTGRFGDAEPVRGAWRARRPPASRSRQGVATPGKSSSATPHGSGSLPASGDGSARSIPMDGRGYRVVGIMPEAFEFPSPTRRTGRRRK